MRQLIRFLQADWPRALRLAAITWLCCIAIDIGNASFVGWLSKLQFWMMLAPFVFFAVALVRTAWFFATYAILSRAMSFDEAYNRFSARR